MHANSLYVKVQNCTANAGLFKWDFHWSKCKVHKDILAAGNWANNRWQTKKGAADEVLVQNAYGKGEVYIHTYSFSGETEVASDLGFE